MGKKKKSPNILAFKQWFEKQCGERPYKGDLSNLEKAIRAGESAKLLLQECYRYDRQRKVARDAWETALSLK